MTKFLTAILVFLTFSTSAIACNTEYNITLKTLGSEVLVELRSGSPGSSRIVQSKRSNGGYVSFTGICPGSYFLAIGNDESVSVTQSRFYESDAVYTSQIVMQKGSGNVSHKSRKSL